LGIRDWFIRKSSEGGHRPGPYYADGGWLSGSSALNFWQMGKNPVPLSASSAMVEACVSAYSQTVAMCPGDHWRKRPDGGRDRLDNSPLSRVIRRPNDYQSISDFLLNLTRELELHGNAYALAIRDERFNIIELHLMKSRSCAYLIGETGEVFYNLSGNEVVDRRFGPGAIVPARDVLHVRLHTPRNVLKGESPLLSAALDVAATNAALNQQLSFLTNQAKPSIMLSTDTVLSREQTKELRAAWDAQTRGDGAGGTPILTGGLKPITVTTSATDAQVAELMKMSEQNIALAFRVPLQILGVGGTPFASTEALMQSWIATGLGFVLNHIEEAIGHLFGLAGYPGEYVEFNTDALLRSAFKDRIDSLAKSVISGIHSPDEARNLLDLGVVPGGFGKMPRVQQQVVPLDWEPPVETPSPLALPAPDPETAPELVPDEADKFIAVYAVKLMEAVNGR